MPSEPNGSERMQRLHPISLLFTIGGAARNLLFPALFVLFMSRGRDYEAWYLVLFLPAVAGYLVRYLSYRYRLGRDDLVIREGILSRNVRHIPYARIQNINLVQNPLHRWFGVAEVRLETASGGKPEAVMRVLALDAVDELRGRVFRGRDLAADRQQADDGEPLAVSVERPQAQGHTLLSLSLGDLVVYGLISNRGLVVVAAALGLLSQSGFFESRFEQWLKRLSETTALPDVGSLQGRAMTIAVLAVLGLVAAVIVMRVLSVLWAIYKLYGFRLRRLGDDLRVEYGLWTRVSATIPRHRIQLLSVHASRLHRLFGRASVYAETAGGGGEEGERGRAQDRLWLAPVIRGEQVAALVAEVLPEIELDSVEWRPVEPRAQRRLAVRGLVVLLLVTGAAAGILRWWSLVLLPLGLPFVLLHARRWVASAGWAVTNSVVLFRSGWWGRRWSAVRFGKIQVVSLIRSPFDRRHRMATVAVDTAGAGRIGHRVAVPFLGETVARGIHDRLYAEAGRTTFHW